MGIKKMFKIGERYIPTIAAAATVELGEIPMALAKHFDKIERSDILSVRVGIEQTCSFYGSGS
jgi:hypothetical protein